MKSETTLLFLGLCLFVFSCASPLPISKLITDAEHSRWVSGRQYIEQKASDIGISLSYYKNEGNTLVFDAVIDNYSAQGIHIDPTKVELLALTHSKEIITRSFAIDPEEKLLKYDKDESIERAELANDATANLFFSATDLVSTVAEENNPNLPEAEKDRRFNQRLYWSEDRANEMERREAYIESLRNTRQYWEEVPIRKTDMQPMQYLEGRLFFERNTTAGYYQVIFHLPNGEDITFEYKQQVIAARGS